MDVIEALKTRKSIRGYKKDPVSKETVCKILETAVRAPSAYNTQPWEFVVASGKMLDQIREECAGLFMSNALPSNNEGQRPPFEGVYRERQMAVGIELFKLMGIGREDKDARNKWVLRNIRMCEAPCEIVVCAKKEMLYHSDIMGLGAVCQSICLAALGYDLGTCIAGIPYDQVWRKYANIPESKSVVVGIAMGYPDPEFAANKLASTRESVDAVTTWFGF